MFNRKKIKALEKRVAALERGSVVKTWKFGNVDFKKFVKIYEDEVIRKSRKEIAAKGEQDLKRLNEGKAFTNAIRAEYGLEPIEGGDALFKKE